MQFISALFLTSIVFSFPQGIGPSKPSRFPGPFPRERNDELDASFPRESSTNDLGELLDQIRQDQIRQERIRQINDGPSRPPKLERQDAFLSPESVESGFSAASAESAVVAARASAPPSGRRGAFASSEHGSIVPHEG